MGGWLSVVVGGVTAAAQGTGVTPTPLHGSELAREAIRGDVQGVEPRGLNLADALAERVAGVQLSDAQGSLLQPDLAFRGFTASPLLGSSQGLAVYVDGIRFNEPFGDVVSWDLVPDFAIAS